MLDGEAAPLRSNLPAQPTPLVGREHELAELRDRMSSPDVRLVTLVGPAGAGKTRVAIECAASLVDRYADGVHFADLTSVAEAALVVPTLAASLGVRDAGHTTLPARLERVLSDQHLLLVLDNFEHLLGAGPQLAELLAACRGLTMLVTSRAPLNLRWEHQVQVLPLPLPDSGAAASPERLSRVPSVALFVQRAAAVRAGFSLTEENAPVVAEICRALDGLPLAIELAAARTRFMAPRALLARLGDRLRLLEGGAQDHPARQKSLRAALDWSYQLLDPEDQVIFRRLGVFVGGCALDAAAEVCRSADEPTADATRPIESLVQKSLVQVEDVAGEPRIRMLETIRAYAVEMLATTGELAETRRRHARYYLSDGEAALMHAQRRPQAWLSQLELERGNLRAALRWCIDSGESEIAFRSLPLLAWFWRVGGHMTEGRATLAELLSSAVDVAPRHSASALYAAGVLALHHVDYAEALRCCEASLAIRRELGDPSALAEVLADVGTAAAQLGDHARAEAAFRELIAIQRELGDLQGVAESLNNRANSAHVRGDLGEARQLYEESLAVCRAVSYPQDLVLFNLGRVVEEMGDPTEAGRLYDQALRIARSTSDPRRAAVALAGIGEALAARGDLDAGEARLREGLPIVRRLGDIPDVSHYLECLARIAVVRGECERALRLAGAAAALRRRADAPLPPSAQARLDGVIESARRTLRPAAAAAAWSDGCGMNLDEAVAAALTLQQVAAPRGAPAGGLTARESEVAELISGGLTNRQIAAKLIISERTADVHVSNILGKLGLSTRAQIAAWAVESRVRADSGRQGAEGLEART